MNIFNNQRITRYVTSAILLLAIRGHAMTQDSAHISITATNTPIEIVLRQIEKQSGLSFIYSKKTLDGEEQITVRFAGLSLTNVLNELFKNKNITWRFIQKSIVLRTKNNVQSTFKTEPADTIPKMTITGIVKNESGQPIAGATIFTKHEKRFTMSDSTGSFLLKNVSSLGSITVSSIGYVTEEIELKKKNAFTITLIEKVTELKNVEVVSTGYQTFSKEKTTGSFATIDNTLFNRKVSSNVLDRLDDIVPGLLKLRETGKPTSLENYRIRGLSTINANKTPLLVIDNFIYDGDLNSINPNDIENITVLRDASAASIWGVRAGNGVIVMTTKRGNYNQKTRVSINSNITVQEKPRLEHIPSIPSRDIVALERKRFENGYYDPYLEDTRNFPVIPPVAEILANLREGRISQAQATDQISLLENYDIRSDISKYLLQPSMVQQYAANISGGSNVYSYYSSIGYDKNRSDEVNNINDRLSIRFNNTWMPIKKLLIRAEINWVQSTSNDKNSLSSYTNILTSPYFRLSDPEGNALAIPFKYRLNYVDTVKFPSQLDWHYRPLDEIQNGNNVSKSYDARIASSISYTVLPGLKAEISYQWQKALTDSREVNSIDVFSTRDRINTYLTHNINTGLPIYPYPLGGVYTRGNYSNRAWNFRGKISLDQNKGRHNISAIAGIETREALSERFGTTEYGYNPQTGTFGVLLVGDWTTRPNLNTGSISPLTSYQSSNINRFASYFSNASYVYDNKYILSASGRIDQSNFFGVKANGRITPLWSAGISWNISNEEFYKARWLPLLKIRFTYGYNGNTMPGITPLATASYRNPVSPLFVQYAILEKPANPQIRWERVRNINLGIDFKSSNNRISGYLEFYDKRGSDLISEITSDPTSGFTSYTGNNASIKGKGIDFSITTNNIKRIFHWNTTFNFSYNTETVTSYSVLPPTGGSSYTNGVPVLIGKPLEKLFSYRWAGLNPQTGDANLYIDKEIVESLKFRDALLEHMVYNGRKTPSIFGAVLNNFTYNNISLSFNISYRFGYYFRRESFSGNFTNMWQHKDYLASWKKPGDEAFTTVPGFLETYPDNRYAVYLNSDILVEKGDHIRLNDIRISYDINPRKKGKLPFSHASIYGYVNNLGIVWKASKYSPDTRGGLNPPLQKTFALGLSISFY